MPTTATPRAATDLSEVGSGFPKSVSASPAMNGTVYPEARLE